MAIGKTEPTSAPDNIWKPREHPQLSGVVRRATAFQRPSNFEQGVIEEVGRIDVVTADGTEWTWYTTISRDVTMGKGPKRDWEAVNAALIAAGVDQIEEGGQLHAQRGPDVPTEAGPAFTFECVYVPPAPGIPVAAPPPQAAPSAPTPRPAAQPAPSADVSGFLQPPSNQPQG